MAQDSSSRQPTIGLLVSSLFDPYQEAILRGARQAALRGGVRLLCFAGAPLGSSSAELEARTAVFKLATAAAVDALLVLVGCVGEKVGAAALGQYVAEELKLPTVAIGIATPGLPSVVVDNEGGMSRLVDHLIQVHGCRHLAYVKGPENNDEARVRFEAYRTALEANQLPYNPSLVCKGSWDDESGLQAVEELVAERRVTFDALIGTDDNNALHALEALRGRGFSIPDRIRVVGFDDIMGGNYSTPSLTTVRQPLHTLGVTGMQLAVELVRGREVPRYTRIATHLILRESCGCTLASILCGVTPEGRAMPGRGSLVPESSRSSDGASNRERGNTQAAPGAPPEGLLSDRAMPPAGRASVPPASEQSGLPLADRLEIALARRHALDVLPEREHLRAFLNAIEAALASGEKGDLTLALDHIVDSSAQTGSPLSLWIEIVTFSLGLTLRFHPSEEDHAFLESLWRDCLFALYHAEARNQAYARYRLEQRGTKLQHVGDRLITSMSLETIEALLRQHLPTLGVRDCQVWRLLPDGKRARCVFSQHRPEDQNLETEATRILEASPSELDPGHWLAVLPLVSESKSLGFAWFEVAGSDGTTCELMAGKIAGALRSAELVEDVRRHNVELELMVADRTHDLVELNRQLREQSFRDQLSGLHNRRFLMEIALPEVQRVVDSAARGDDRRSVRHKDQVSVLLIDLDHFKQVNDTHGHAAGDEVLRQLSHLLEDHVRSGDYVIRMGGEEFLLVLRGADPSVLPAKAELLRRSVERHEFRIDATLTLRRTCSVGCISLPPPVASLADLDLLTAVSLADKALYAAKNDGRNAAFVVSFESESLEGVRSRELLERFSELRDSGGLRLTRLQ